MVRLKVQNYRSFSLVDWTLNGVCALAGPNGAGKTTLIGAFELLRQAYQRGFSAASEAPTLGGAWGFKRLQAPDDEPVSFSLEIGDLRWEADLALLGGAIQDFAAERVYVDNKIVLERYPGKADFSFKGETYSGDALAIKIAFELTKSQSLRPLVDALQRSRIYRTYQLWNLRQHGSPQSSDLYLHPTGLNVFSVLRNWRDKRDLRKQFDLVIEGLQEAFPDYFEDFDFESAGQSVQLRLYVRGLSEPIPHHLAPDGFLIALLHLCAFIGAQDGALLGIDEIENSLHPSAIRVLLEIFREYAEMRQLTVILPTHSPVVLDTFASTPSQVYVLERNGEEQQPVPLTQHRNPDWLAHFSIGSLYANLDFGAH